jgi:transposase-like protein
MDKDTLLSKLFIRLENLERRIVELEVFEKENIILRERLSRYENPKNSRNSSIAPSQDENRPKKNQSLRKSSGKKLGGQLGHKGKTLEMTGTPDIIIKLKSDYCKNCGSPLEGMPIFKELSRQVIDIEPVKVICTEYQSHIKTCSCGCKSEPTFPLGVNASVSYGENIESLVGYFHARQYLPFARMKEVFNDVFNINISESGVHCLLNRFAKKTSNAYQIIRQRVHTSSVVGSDETGIKVNGKRQWIWTWQTPKLTYICHSSNRATNTIEMHFPKGFPQSTLVHDGWRPQLNTIAKYHQSCLAHLLRQLNYLNEKYKNDYWATSFQELLYCALNLKKEFTFENEIFTVKRIEIVMQLENLLSKPPDKKDKELYTFHRRMCRERQHLFTFLYIQEVPPDNNASERAIRNVKVKQKISGQFKTERTAQNFAMIRSVIDTTIKNGMNVFQTMKLIAKLESQHAY